MKPDRPHRSLRNIRMTAHLHWHFMGMGFLVCVCFAICSAVIVFLLASMQNDILSQLDPALADGLARETRQIVILFVAQLFFFLGGIFLVLILSAHRIAGPYIALKRTLARIREGDTATRLQFRKTDKLDDVAEAFNQMMDAHFPAETPRSGEVGPGEPPARAENTGMTLLEVMIVVFLIGLLATLAIPTFTKPRETARLKICQSNQRILEQAKELWAMEKEQGAGATPDVSDLDPYVKGGAGSLRCPSGGRRGSFEDHYELGPVGEHVRCRIVPEMHVP